MYLVAFLSALIVDTIPVFAPPAWTILVFLIIEFKLNPWPVVALGAVGSTIGRWILSMYIPKVAGKILSRRENENVRYVGGRIGKRFWPSFIFVLIYSLTPLSTTALFTAAGIARIKMLHVLPAFFIGKFASDAVMVFSGKFAVEESKQILHGQFSWHSVVVALVSLVLILAIMFIDWKQLLENKKLRFHFKIWA